MIRARIHDDKKSSAVRCALLRLVVSRSAFVLLCFLIKITVVVSSDKVFFAHFFISSGRLQPPVECSKRLNNVHEASQKPLQLAQNSAVFE